MRARAALILFRNTREAFLDHERANGELKLTGVDPQAYLTEVLIKLVNLWPTSRIDELMPWAWAAERSPNKLAA
jgi:hypothetical protein